jgi:hypothetical protein
MLGEFQDLDDFPRWLWPHIDGAAPMRRAKPESGQNEAVRTPAAAVAVHAAAIFAAAALKRYAALIEDAAARRQLEITASAAMASAIDDCGNCAKKPWPRPPRHQELIEIAAQLAIAAAAVGEPGMSADLARAASMLTERARSI